MFSSAPTSLFNNDLKSFKKMIKKYLETIKYHDINLTNQEFQQLSWYIGNSNITPEARGEDIAISLNFEIKRSLTRFYCFQLLLRGDENAYQEFIQEQPKTTLLPFSVFLGLSAQAKSLGENIQAAVRASCFLTTLTVSDKAKKAFEAAMKPFPADSEEFLSDLATIVRTRNDLFPVTEKLSKDTLDLFESMYKRNMHLRHMLYTEGGDNMTETFSDAIKKGNFKEQDFLVWQWRWLTNLFGFQGGKGAKYYNEQIHLLVTSVLAELKKMLVQPTYSYLDNYLLKRAELAGLCDQQFNLSHAEQQLLGHLAAYFSRINIVTKELGYHLWQGYDVFKKEFTDGKNLATQYESYRQDPATVTHTYVPAVINTAYFIFTEKFQKSDAESQKLASQFMCQLLSELYALPHDKRISCFHLAQEATLQNVLEKWNANHYAFDFKLDTNFELIAEAARELRTAYKA